MRYECDYGSCTCFNFGAFRYRADYSSYIRRSEDHRVERGQLLPETLVAAVEGIVAGPGLVLDIVKMGIAVDNGMKIALF